MTKCAVAESELKNDQRMIALGDTDRDFYTCEECKREEIPESEMRVIAPFNNSGLCDECSRDGKIMEIWGE